MGQKWDEFVEGVKTGLGICPHDWEELGREYHAPRSGQNLNWSQFERFANGWTLYKLKCKRCGKRDEGYRFGDWTDDVD